MIKDILYGRINSDLDLLKENLKNVGFLEWAFF